MLRIQFDHNDQNRASTPLGSLKQNILVCLITSRCIRYLLKDLSVPHQVPSTMFVVHIKSVEIRA